MPIARCNPYTARGQLQLTMLLRAFQKKQQARNIEMRMQQQAMRVAKWSTSDIEEVVKLNEPWLEWYKYNLGLVEQYQPEKETTVSADDKQALYAQAGEPGTEQWEKTLADGHAAFDRLMAADEAAPGSE